ncbi:MAG: helix-turn-helix domain-containing protein [Anaerolineales bacterium]
MTTRLEGHLTVREVWELALPRDTALLGGAGGLDSPVAWCASIRATFPAFGDMEEEYVALVSLEMARRLDPRLTPRYLLEQLHRLGASAFVVDETPDPADVRLADELALPVLQLPPGFDLHDVERDILRTLVDREGQLARREKEIRQRVQRAFSRGGMEAVVNDLARFSSAHIVVEQENGVSLVQSEGLLENESASGADFLVEVGGRSLGRLVLYGKAIGSLDRIYAREAAEMCGVEMLRRLSRRETEERLGVTLVDRLLEEEVNEDGLTSRFLHLGYDPSPDRCHVVVAVGATEGSEGEDTAAETLERDLRRAAQAEGPIILSVPYRESHLLFCGFDDAMDAGRARRWVRRVLSNVQLDRAFGVSRIVQGLEGLRDGVRQALGARGLGQQIAERRGACYYEELGLYRLLADLRDREALDRFCEDVLGDLLHYDKANGTELIHTLKVFFRQNSNVSQAAQALYVHRNTLNYRLDRIAEITGLDLNDAEACLCLQLALKIHDLAG